MALLHTPTPVHEAGPHLVWRRVWAVALGALSTTLLVLTAAAIYNVGATYGSIFAGGWLALWIISLGLAYLIGAVGVVLWSPPGTLGTGRRSTVVMASVMVIVFIVMWFVGPLY